MSLSDKTKRWLKENCNIPLNSKTILVTGVNSGVGFKTAEIAVSLGADVILVRRNMERAQEARLKLISDYPEASISIIHKIATVDYADFYYERGKHYPTFPVYARSKLCLARYTYAQAKRYAGSNVRILMNHPGMTLTPMGLNALGNGIRQLTGIVEALSNSPEKSALSLAYILSHEIPAGSIIGPNKGFGGWGYPEMNCVGHRVKEGADELIRFTNMEIEKAKA